MLLLDHVVLTLRGFLLKIRRLMLILNKKQITNLIPGAEALEKHPPNKRWPALRKTPGVSAVPMLHCEEMRVFSGVTASVSLTCHKYDPTRSTVHRWQSTLPDRLDVSLTLRVLEKWWEGERVEFSFGW